MERRSSLISKLIDERVDSYFSALDVFDVQINENGEIKNMDSIGRQLGSIIDGLDVSSAFFGIIDGRAIGRNGEFYPNFNGKSSGREWYTGMRSQSKFITNQYKNTSGKSLIGIVRTIKIDGNIIGAVSITRARSRMFFNQLNDRFDDQIYL